MDRVTLSDKSSLIYSHYYITTLFRFLNLEQVFDVPSLIPWVRPLERGSALMTKAGTDQQTFNFARISSSGVQILLVTPSHFEICFSEMEEWRRQPKGDSNGDSSLEFLRMQKQ